MTRKRRLKRDTEEVKVGATTQQRTRDDSDDELEVGSLLPKKESLDDCDVSSVECSKVLPKKRKLRKLVTSNRHSLAKMPPEQQAKTCAICLDEVKGPDQAELDSCQHAFCFVCINQWVQSENSCPLCKQEITKITRVDSKQKKQVTQVQKRT